MTINVDEKRAALKKFLEARYDVEYWFECADEIYGEGDSKISIAFDKIESLIRGELSDVEKELKVEYENT